MTARASRPIDRDTFATGILSITAIVMLVGLIIVQSSPPAVRGDAMTVSGGDYLMTVGSLADTDEDYLYIIDTPSSKMAVYRFDTATDRIQIVQGIELKNLRTPTGEPEPVDVDNEDKDTESDPKAPGPD